MQAAFRHLLFALTLFLMTALPSFADPFDCDQLSTTFPGLTFTATNYGRIYLPTGPFGLRSILGVGVLGTAYISGQPSPTATTRSLGGNQFEIKVKSGGSAQGQFLVQCRENPNDIWSTNIWGATVQIYSRGAISANQNVLTVGQTASDENEDTYQAFTLGNPASVKHEVYYLIGGEVIPPSGGILGESGGLGNFTPHSTSNIIPLNIGPPTCSATEGSDSCNIDPEKVNNPKPPEETGPTCNPGVVGDPCEAYSGNYFHNELDLLVSGLLPLQVKRAYHSGKSAFMGDFGVGSHLENYTYRLDIPKDSNNQVSLAANTEIKFNTGNDSLIVFKNPNGGNVFTNNALLGTIGDTITLNVTPDGTLTEALYRNPKGEVMRFNSNGWLMATEDRNGNQITFTRDTQGRLQQLTETSTGRYIQFTYNADGLISQATDTAGRTVSYTYSAAKELLTVTNPASQAMNYTWDDQHRIISKTDFNGVTKMTNEYGPTGAVTKQTQADGNDIKLEAFSDTVRKVTDPNGHVTIFRYNEQGLVTEVEDALGHKLKTRYAPNMFTNNTANRFVETEDPLGRINHIDLNTTNLPITSVDAAGQQTHMEYDTAHPDRIKKITDPKGHITQFSYDVKGNLTQITNNADNSTIFTHNAKGQVLTVTNVLGAVTRFAYNTQNDLVSVTDPLGNKTLYTYDNLSRPIKITDPKGNKTNMVYDALNRVTAVADALNNTTTYTYEANGNVLSVTDPKGQTTNYSYDTKDRLVSSTNAKGETYSYQYDGADNLLSVTDPKGQVTTNSFDPANRVIKVTFDDSTKYSYTYDPASQMVSLNDGSGAWGFTYDLLGRVTAATSPQGAVNYTYDANGNVTQLSSPSYGNVSYTYDELGQVASISKAGKTYSYSYDTLGRRTGLDRPNGVTSSYEYDAGNHLTALTHNKGTQVLEKHDYDYDSNGNIVKYVRGKGTSRPVVIRPCGRNGRGKIRQIAGYITDKAEEIERTYTYDALDRLTAVNGLGMVPSASDFKNSGNKLAAASSIEMAKQARNPQAKNQLLRNAEKLGAVLPESAAWQFDGNGNIVKKTLKTTDGDKAITYTYDEADRLVSLTRPLEDDNDDRPCPYRWRHHTRGHWGRHHGRPGRHNPAPDTETITLDYDANGNLISDSMGRTFTWNALDQLTRLQTDDATSQFGYDPLGRRIIFSKGAQTKSYLYDGLDALTDGTSKFLHGASLDEPLQVDTAAASQSYLQDHLGSTSQLLNSATGQSQTRYDYKSYGKLEGDTDNRSLTNSYTYTGREDDSTGLYFYRNRFYDPELEIFISEDPLGDAQRYVQGNPIAFNDPLGLWYRDANGYSQPDPEDWYNDGTEDETSLVTPGGPIRLAGCKLFLGGIAKNGLKQAPKFNPFKGKTPQQIMDMFKKKGFEYRPGKNGHPGGWLNPKSGRSYHLDPGGQYRKGFEKPHIDVNRKYKNPSLDKTGIKDYSQKRKFER